MVFPLQRITQNAQETKKLGEEFGYYITHDDRMGSDAIVICLWGDLGSGKTTFVSGFAHALGHQGRLPSPTFIIVRRYDIALKKVTLYHCDLYRITGPQEAKDAGVLDFCTEPRSIVCIEWPERLANLLPESRWDVYAKVLSNDQHEIVIKKI